MALNITAGEDRFPTLLLQRLHFQRQHDLPNRYSWPESVRTSSGPFIKEFLEFRVNIEGIGQPCIHLCPECGLGFGIIPLLDHSKTLISDFKQGATIVDRMVANVTLSVHRKINCRLFIVVSHLHLQNKKRKAPVTGPSSVDNALVVKHFA